MNDDLFTVDTSGTSVLTPQLGTEFNIVLSDGRCFRFLPQRNMSGYQAALVAKLLTLIACNHAGYAFDDLFYSVHRETAQHWIPVTI